MPDLAARAIDLAKRATVAEGAERLAAHHVLAATLADPELEEVLSRTCLGGRSPVVPERLAGLAGRIPAIPAVTGKVPLEPSFRALYHELWRVHRGTPPLGDLLRGILSLPDEALAGFVAANRREGSGEDVPRPQSRLGTLSEEVTGLENLLGRKVIGQRRAVRQIADAVFQARLYRRSGARDPRAVLLFLGPPGVGKTYTAELIARALVADERAFLRLDMSSYADRDAWRILVGFEPSYQGARPGILTSHVRQYPDCLVLVDEIEKASPAVHNLFLQVLDRGVLEDKHTRENVPFDRSILVFTTNLGRDLYAGGTALDSPSGAIPRPAVLEALTEARDPLTNLPVLRPELVSRLAKGYPILFHHLSPLDLEEIARLALEDLGVELGTELGLRFPPLDPRIVTLLLLRLGPDLDARSVSAGVPLLVKDALREALAEHREELLGASGSLERVTTLRIGLPGGDASPLDGLPGNRDAPVLVISSTIEADRFAGQDSPANIRVVADGPAAASLLRADRFLLALVDVAPLRDRQEESAAEITRTLRTVRAAARELPVYLFDSTSPEPAALHPTIERLVVSGGARRFVPGPFELDDGEGDPAIRSLREEAIRERIVREAFRTRQNVEFHWTARLRWDDEDKEGTILLEPGDIRTRTVVASRDRTARLTFTGIPRERFADVAGAREAKRRMGEIIGWMRNPELLERLGVDLPRGILLEGPPGNGKTLLARALAGEAGLPFFAVSATDFSSKWVGESEANIRELFERAATYAPSILFIDEIDAIGTARSNERSGVHDSMLNQLLVSMDGFVGRDRPVFFLAATNRADMLDPALKRPGRFDLVLTVDDLDLEARRDLLRLRTGSLPLADDVDLDALARAAAGLSGARLSRVVQEAAILALRAGGERAEDLLVTMDLLREALTNVRYGMRREGPPPAGDDQARTAAHEAGHALLAELERPGSVHQATILPRGRALGFVESLPDSENGTLTASEIRGRIRVALAGRLAEELLCGPDGASAGCTRDLEQATRLATLAVARCGMSAAVGPVSVPELERLLPGGGAAAGARREVERMLRAEEDVVRDLLARHREALEAIRHLLLTDETVPGKAIAAAIHGTRPASAGRS